MEYRPHLISTATLRDSDYVDKDGIGMTTRDEEQLLNDLIVKIGRALSDIGAEYTPEYKHKEDERTTFKMNNSRVYCYVRHQQNSRSGTCSNVVFRFRTGDNPRNWFRTNVVPATARAWLERFRREYSAEAGTSRMYVEPARVTDQFGVPVTHEDLRLPDFEESLAIYVRIAVVAARTAHARINRDWSEYESLTA